MALREGAWGLTRLTSQHHASNFGLTGPFEQVGEGRHIMDGHLWVEPSGDLIVARVRGTPTEDLLHRCQKQVLQIVADSGRTKVLYDTLEMEPPPVDVPWSQRALDERMGAVRLRRAIVVPTSRLAYLARLAFGEGDYRVFYNDIGEAIRWLQTP